MGENEDAGHSRSQGRGEPLRNFVLVLYKGQSWYARWGIYQHVWYSSFVEYSP